MGKKLSISQSNSWQRCKKQWELGYVQKVTPRIERPNIGLGSAVHVGLEPALKFDDITPSSAIEQWHLKKLESGELFEEEEQQLKDTAELAVAIANRTIENLDLGHKWDTLLDVDDVPLVECHFEIPMVSGPYSTLQGYIDWIAVEVETGRRWLVDHKVRETFMGDENEEFNQQMAIYKKALNENYDYGIYGSISHQIKSVAPREPSVNKNGTISKQKILTDWPTYKRTCVENGQNPDDYLDMKEKLNEVEWFRFSRAYWPDELVDAFYANLRDGAADIGKGHMTRSISFMNCKGCRLRDFCFAEMRGDDLDFLLRTSFKHKDEKHTPLPTEIELVE